MGKREIRREALQRQGRCIDKQGHLFIWGNQRRGQFKEGSEGVVHLAVHKKTNVRYRVKCFFEPTDARWERSKILTAQKLADLSRTSADALGGAPFQLIDDIDNSPNTRFAIVMKDVVGESWRDLREKVETADRYPPDGWAAIQVRATWAYGLATAVKNMEARGFIHADLSPGNIMVMPDGETAGDMALVDFDSFVHPRYPMANRTLKGTEGYSAPEISMREAVIPGSDRVGMAILVQELLLVGDPDISRDEAIGWAYAQEDEIEKRKGDPHALVKKKHPWIAELVAATLRAQTPAERPAPELWRPFLKALAERAPLSAVRLKTVTKTGAVVEVNDADPSFNLLPTAFRIRATLQRASNGDLDVVAHHGATINFQLPGSTRWHFIKSGEKVRAEGGMVLFDRRGNMSARLEAK